MMKVSHEIKIKAELASVWQKTIDVESWPTWNPVMNSVVCNEQKEISVGSTVQVDQQGMRPCIWTVQKFEKEAAFAWSTKTAGIRMLAIHELKVEEGFVVNKLTLEVQGVLGVLLWPLLKGPMLKALRNENSHFKSYCEDE